MDAREQHVRAPAEDLGGAVAVMDVPVEDEHSAQAEFGDRDSRRDCDVVEQAEAHCPPVLGVVPGGPHAAEAHATVAGEERTGHLTGTAGGVQRRRQ